MRWMKVLLTMAFGLAVALAAGQAWAAEGEGPPPDKGGKGPHPLLPLMRVLDANGDHELSADEIANASTALKRLDKNGDGKLTPDELRPPRPRRDGEAGPPDKAGRGAKRGGRPNGPPAKQDAPPAENF